MSEEATRGPDAAQTDDVATWPDTDGPVTRLAPGRMLVERYRITSLLGSGGMADVYEAWDVELDEAVAVKVLHPNVAHQATMVHRFKKEIKLARRIVHPNVCRIYDFGRAGQLKFVTMEVLRGSTFDAICSGTPAPDLDTLLALFREMLTGLEAAHRMGVVHRDLKPQNVMITPEGHAVLMDFGIARDLTATEVTTATSDMVGTPAYMAPERLLGKQADQRSDIYSLGVLLCELAAGRRPFSGVTVFELAKNQLSKDPPKPSEIKPGLPPWLDRMVLKMLEKRQEDRFQSVAEVLREFPTPVPDAPRTGGPVAGDAAPSEPAGAPARSILLVDDDPTLRSVVEIYLNQAGVSVLTAKDGAEGIEIVLKEEPDLLCLDFDMPQMDGFQVATTLRRMGSKVPIFMLTGMQDPQYEKEAVRLGIERFFTKPLDLEEFVTAVRQRLRL